MLRRVAPRSAPAEAFSAHLAGRPPSRATGVFVGVSQLEYARISLEAGAALNTYYATGAHLSVASGGLAGRQDVFPGLDSVLLCKASLDLALVV